MALLQVHVRHVPTGQVSPGGELLGLWCRIRQSSVVQHACWLLC